MVRALVQDKKKAATAKTKGADETVPGDLAGEESLIQELKVTTSRSFQERGIGAEKRQVKTEHIN